MTSTPCSFDCTSGPVESKEKSDRARSHVHACFQQINLDVQRTGGTTSSSSSTNTYVDRGKVAAVLEAWSVLNPQVVYTQGLNEVTAMLLLRHRGSQSAAMLELQRLVAPGALGGLWFSGMPLYQAGRQQFRPLATVFIPQLQMRFDDAGLDESAYLPQAWHSLFAKWLPQELAVAAVDDLLTHGMGAVLAITLAILEEVQHDIFRALDQPGAEAIEVLLGPDGFFTGIRDLLQRCGPVLQNRWQELCNTPEVESAGDASYHESANVSPSRCMSGSMIQAVQQEAVLQLANSASKRHDDRVFAMVQNVNEAQERAIRDELTGRHDFLVKVAILGDLAVGKSSLIDRATKSGSFTDSWGPTDGVDFASKSVRIRGFKAKLQIWDLPGRTSFINVTRSYLHDVAVVLLVFDISCRESFEGLEEWLQEIMNTSNNPDIMIFLVGNKMDRPQHRQVDYAEAAGFAASRGMHYFECSARRGDNVESIFVQVADTVYRHVEHNGGATMPGVRFRYGSFTGGGRLLGCRRIFAEPCTVM